MHMGEILVSNSKHILLLKDRTSTLQDIFNWYPSSICSDQPILLLGQLLLGAHGTANEFHRKQHNVAKVLLWNEFCSQKQC